LLREITYVKSYSVVTFAVIFFFHEINLEDVVITVLLSMKLEEIQLIILNSLLVELQCQVTVATDVPKRV